MIVKAPLIRPEPPAPAIARPTINIVELEAAPHNTNLISKVAKNVKKLYLLLNIVYIFPDSGRRAALPSIYALPYQPMSGNELN